MDNRLFVGNLSFQTNADQVREVFAEFGGVEDVHLVTDRETGRSRGFAFVTMATSDEANKAIQEMNGQQLDGRPLRVNLAEERPRRTGPGGGGGGFGGGGGGGGFGGGGDRGRGGGFGGGGGGGGFGDDRGGGRGGRGGRGGDRGGRGGGDRGGRW
jgi:cold-inducible RNA-binding protein